MKRELGKIVYVFLAVGEGIGKGDVAEIVMIFICGEELRKSRASSVDCIGASAVDRDRIGVLAFNGAEIVKAISRSCCRQLVPANHNLVITGRFACELNRKLGTANGAETCRKLFGGCFVAFAVNNCVLRKGRAADADGGVGLGHGFCCRFGHVIGFGSDGGYLGLLFLFELVG